MKYRLDFLFYFDVVHRVGNFIFAKPENQRGRQLEMRSSSRSYISQGDQVGYGSGGGTVNDIR